MVNEQTILDLLYRKKNVLLMGAPGTGKSKIMNDVAKVFEATHTAVAQPVHMPSAPIPIPANPGTGVHPILSAKNRKVFRTTLHQNSKYREFLSGITPVIGSQNGYEISKGILYRANEFAKQPDSAALLIIDELNRGPAVEVFGGSIVAIESDKRLSDQNQPLQTTQFFEMLSPVTGKMEEYAFAPNLYILAAMNQADVSVAPLDVAFLRRWQPQKLEPDYSVLYGNFGVDATAPLPTSCQSATDVYAVAIKALEKINAVISIGRGKDYQLGQGVFLSTKPLSNNVADALTFVAEAWCMIYAHIEELFFGDCVSIAYVVNANSPKSPYTTKEVSFADETKMILQCENIDTQTIFDLYLSIAGRTL